MADAIQRDGVFRHRVAFHSGIKSLPSGKLSIEKPPGQCPGGKQPLLSTECPSQKASCLQAVIVFLFRACIQISRTGLERLSRRPCLWNHTSNHL